MDFRVWTLVEQTGSGWNATTPRMEGHRPSNGCLLAQNPSPVAKSAPRRHDPREEPDANNARPDLCGGIRVTRFPTAMRWRENGRRNGGSRSRAISWTQRWPRAGRTGANAAFWRLSAVSARCSPEATVAARHAPGCRSGLPCRSPPGRAGSPRRADRRSCAKPWRPRSARRRRNGSPRPWRRRER